MARAGEGWRARKHWWRALVPLATARSARAVPRRERKRGRGRSQGRRASRRTRPSSRVPPTRRRPWCSPRRKRLRDTPGSRVQLWLRVSPVRLSPAAPPPSLETGWSNVSSEAPGPTSKLSKSRRAASSRPPCGLCPAAVWAPPLCAGPRTPRPCPCAQSPRASLPPHSSL